MLHDVFVQRIQLFVLFTELLRYITKADYRQQYSSEEFQVRFWHQLERRAGPAGETADRTTAISARVR